ncbi:hypothetical protein C7S14_7881 [Burkholderia cepacia]|nr:hypothetical protein C7S14_7881 [Burkholderia cepacia]
MSISSDDCEPVRRLIWTTGEAVDGAMSSLGKWPDNDE